MIFSGIFALSIWKLVLATLVLTHITIASVTIFLHRHQSHKALQLHPLVSHFFRFWLWLTTGMVTKEWVAVHRKHHSKCETPEDPHSPVIHGILRVLFLGVVLYSKETHNQETMEKYGHGTPDDWIERHLYTPYNFLGVVVMGLIDLACFGLVPGAVIFVVQMIWIPFWAAGVINGVGHWWGYRTHKQLRDVSRNIFPWGILIGGEELHNNHHADPTSAKLCHRWFELDIGWIYIRMLAFLRLARVN
jgi:stearoyl-CoA desaturase (delta-9 desaturase)